MSLFYFKQKTAYYMRISDWSSDVCSSDLAEQPEGTHLTEDLGIGDLVVERFDHARGEFVGGVGLRGIADHTLIVGELVVEKEGVRPVEGCHAGHDDLLCSSEERRVGKEGVSTCRSRCSQFL